MFTRSLILCSIVTILSQCSYAKEHKLTLDDGTEVIHKDGQPLYWAGFNLIQLKSDGGHTSFPIARIKTATFALDEDLKPYTAQLQKAFNFPLTALDKIEKVKKSVTMTDLMKYAKGHLETRLAKTLSEKEKLRERYDKKHLLFRPFRKRIAISSPTATEIRSATNISTPIYSVRAKKQTTAYGSSLSIIYYSRDDKFTRYKEGSSVTLEGVITKVTFSTGSQYYKTKRVNNYCAKIVVYEDDLLASMTYSPDGKAPAAMEGHFRNATWAMSKLQVKQTEALRLVTEKPEMLAYQGSVAGANAAVVYLFKLDKLVRASYALQDEHTNPNDYIADYKKMKGLLTKKYGEPNEDSTIWKQDLLKDQPQNWGTAISAGHLFLRCRWEVKGTKISLLLFGDNFEISHIIHYQSQALKPLEDKEAEKQALKGL